MSTTWNLWHGCTKVSADCRNCYVYRRDADDKEKAEYWYFRKIFAEAKPA